MRLQNIKYAMTLEKKQCRDDNPRQLLYVGPRIKRNLKNVLEEMRQMLPLTIEYFLLNLVSLLHTYL